MISIYLKGGLGAESLGGVEGLINHQPIMTYASVLADRREALGIHENIARLSVGVEDVAGLKAELHAALETS